MNQEVMSSEATLAIDRTGTGTGTGGSADLAVRREPTTNPVAAYLAQLSPGSRAGQFSALACALPIARGDRLGDLPRDQAEGYRAEVWATDWTALRPEHISAIRSSLAAALAILADAVAAIRQAEGEGGRVDLYDDIDSPGGS